MVSPRFGQNFDVDVRVLQNGEKAIIVTGGVILSVRNAPNIGLLDIEADRLVIFTRNNDAQQLFNNMRAPEGESKGDLEFYLSGNVEIRQQTGKENRTLKAAEVYYDVNRNVAVALSSTLQLKGPGQQNNPSTDRDIFIRSDELFQTSATTYEVVGAEIFSSKLISDPGLKVYLTRATIEDRSVPKASIFGRLVTDRRTGEQVMQKQTWVRGEDVYFELENVPFFYLPYLVGDARDPLGPIQNIQAGYNKIFGGQFGLSWNMYDLLGIQAYEGTRWRLDTDYMTARGPGLGSTFDFSGLSIFGVPAYYNGIAKGYMVYDHGTDNLGGDAPHNDFQPTALRGRFLVRENIQGLPDGFTVQWQGAYVSDRNFLEEYFRNEWDTDLNQSTYLYVKQQQDNWAWTIQGGPRTRDWVEEAIWLPRADGYLLNQSFLDRFTYNAHASAGYGRLFTTSDGLPLVSPLTDMSDNTGRFDLIQELAFPFQAGPFKIVPYGKLDLAFYTEDENGDARGRVWGGLGVRGSIPFTRLYPDIESTLFNVNGINHKIIFGANYFYADSTDRYFLYPQLDRFNDDASDQSVRDAKDTYVDSFPGAKAFILRNTPVFDPQLYAIRTLMDNHVDTLDQIDVLQLEVSQRWQTKRGYPGMEHIIDWMKLDLSASIFPQAARDNFGQVLGLLQYDWLWNIGDRTALVSSGWFDTESYGPRVFSVGAYVNRTDRTSFYLGYRQVDPLATKAIIGSATYIFSPKYALTAGVTYDFGTSVALTESVSLTRIGTDLQVSFGITYNALQSNLGVTFEIIPNLLADRQRAVAFNSVGAGGALGR
jgi:hypothetical protein